MTIRFDFRMAGRRFDEFTFSNVRKVSTPSRAA